MILEIADIRVQPGKAAGFEAALTQAIATVLSRAKGVRGHAVHKCIESPERFVLQILWDTLEDHNVGFRQGPLFAEWRGLIGPFFAAPPLVEHFTLVTKS